jgi:predicted AAA+ superfamily ATPase
MTDPILSCETATSLLARIADALERMAPPAPPPVDWLAAPAYVWTGQSARGVDHLEAPALGLMRGIDAQKAAVVANVERLASGAAAHDMLLWGSRGMGKSAVLRAAVKAADVAHPGQIALVQAMPDATLPLLFGQLRGVDRRFLVFLDDLGFDAADTEGARLLRSWLEGGVEARPANVRLAVTSNRRAIVERTMSEQDDPINPRDAVDDRLALADRFGLSLGFTPATRTIIWRSSRAIAGNWACRSRRAMRSNGRSAGVAARAVWPGNISPNSRAARVRLSDWACLKPCAGRSLPAQGLSDQSNRLETEASSAMRRMASPISGAMVRMRMRSQALVASVGRMVSVITSSLSAELPTRATAAPESTPCEM